MTSLRIVFFLALLYAAGAAGDLRAQSTLEQERSRYSQAAYYNYVEPGDLTILVNVWGTVRNAGLYEVPQGTHLSTLFSIAGGPAIGERHRRDRRSIVIHLSRAKPEGAREVVYEATMDDEIFAMEEDPVLQEGDVLTVETIVRQRLSWRDVFPVVAAVGTVALTVERLFGN